jgi:dTDP-4-amino-4,6-dideoxygalactose transaminase
MSQPIPFLYPSLPSVAEYSGYLATMDDSHWYSNFGPLNQEFEARLLSEFFDSEGALTTVVNCTLGLMLALSAIKRPQGKYVVMPSFTFAATPLSAVWAGLTPYFVDVNESDWVANQRAIKDAVEELGDELAAVIVYNTFGTAIDLEPFAELHRSGVPVIIDAAPSFGARTVGGQPFGKGFPGLLAFSLHATKPFGIGEGGLLYSGNAELIEQVRRLSNFGFDQPGVTSAHGVTAKLPEISAAVGLAVCDGYAGKMERLIETFQLYVDELKGAGLFDLGVQLQEAAGHVPHQSLPILIPPELDIEAVEAGMMASGVGVRRYFMPSCHQQAEMRGFPRGDLGVTDRVSGRVMSLPLWDGLSPEKVSYVVRALTQQLSD